MNVKKAQEGELLKERVKYLTQEAKGKEADHDAEIQRYESNLNFSRYAISLFTTASSSCVFIFNNNSWSF